MDQDFNYRDRRHLYEIRTFLEKNGIEYSTERGSFLIKGVDGKRDYDIEYISSKNFPIAYPKYGIEGVSQNFFFNKSMEAFNNNSFKCWVKDFEWANYRQREVLKSYFLHAANKTPYNFYARQCEIKEVRSKEGTAFEKENCFYGPRGASLRLGLYNKKERHGVPAGSLLMLYTFGKNFFAKDEHTIEVIRVGTRKFSYVAGGASRLFKYFLNNYKTIKVGKKDVPVNRVIYYVDWDHNNGSSIESSGFKFKDFSGGGFMNYWLDEGIAKQRQPMKHKQIMKDMADGKVIAIPNAGVRRFILER